MSVQPLKTGMKFVKLDNNKKTIPKIKENVTPKSEKNDKYSYHREPKWQYGSSRMLMQVERHLLYPFHLQIHTTVESISALGVFRQH